MGIVSKLRLFRGGVFMQGDPVVSRAANFAEYIVVPGAMIAALWCCPDDDPWKNKAGVIKAI